MKQYFVQKKTYIDNNGIEIVSKKLSRKELITTMDQRRSTKILFQGHQGSYDGKRVSSRRLDLGPKTVKYSKMSDA